MVKNERIIKFPVPDWKRLFSKEFDKITTCFCYQYDIDEGFYGPYGFDSSIAKKIINDFISEFLFYDVIERNLINVNNVYRNGLYVSSDGNPLGNEIESYSMAVKKNELRKRRGLNEIEVKKPMLLSMDSECKIPDKVIFHLINNHIPFFIVNGYMPEAGKSIMIFSDEVVERFLDVVRKYNVDICAVDNIDLMKSW
ncbi:hypothetical protein N3553_13530 [Pantoea dispersa]|uniref:hypothetical protein n=1 Tax=Pantoea dispersa TaxID=59814 RepID=UPI0021AF7A04|nr:hypothetical protein [Pantoea dispersa]MCT6590894.1 hypothetical protein [Pantoea dispersa]MCW0322156.1 hypothetical protein [Pantoea dispersa]MCW0326810.1 hypothetical protein [Pantoea dispersa]MCW0433318.1 hypothetical protein [Pantoea dispersa]